MKTCPDCGGILTLLETGEERDHRYKEWECPTCEYNMVEWDGETCADCDDPADFQTADGVWLCESCYLSLIEDQIKFDALSDTY